MVADQPSELTVLCKETTKFALGDRTLEEGYVV